MKTVLITGCSNGFGKITALSMAQEGYHVLAAMRNSKSANKKIADELSKINNVTIIDLDVSSVLSITETVQNIKNNFPEINILVNNAGVAGIGLSELFDYNQVKRLFETNVLGLFELTRQIIPLMRNNKKGLIISVSSLMGRFVLPTWGVYCASKYAVEAMAEAWRYELAPVGIDSVILEPGAFPTTNIGANMPQYSPAVASEKIKNEYGMISQMPMFFNQQMQQEIENGTNQDPEMIAKSIVKIIETPYGKRPLRVVVDQKMDEMISQLNNYTDQLQNQIMSNLS